MFYIFATQQKDLGGDPNLGKIAIAINDVYQDEMEIFDAADNALTVYEAESFVGEDWQSIIQTIHLTLQDDQQLSPLDSVFKIVATTDQILDVLSTDVNHVVDKAFLKKVAYAILDNTKDAEVSETLIQKMSNRNPLAFLRNDDRFLEKFITNAQFTRNVFGQIFDIIIGSDDEQLVDLLFWKQKAFVTNRVRDLMFFKLVNEQEIHDGFVEYVALSPDQFIEMAKILAKVNVEQLALLARRKDIDEVVVNKITELLFLNYESGDSDWKLVFSALSKRNALSMEQTQFLDDFYTTK